MPKMGDSHRDLRLERDFFISQIMVGDCPKCGSKNTHDCEGPDFYLDSNSPKQVVKTGSECGVARELEDPTIGHCDSCDHLWCIECGSMLAIDDKACGHWAVCEECSKENGYMTPDETVEKICPHCEHWKDGCQLEDPSECDKTLEYECPHQEDISECPTVIEWRHGTKNEEDQDRVHTKKDNEKIQDIFNDYAEIVAMSEYYGVPLSEETEYVKDMLVEHPEYAQDFQTGNVREGMNPRLHIFTEAMVQTQITKNNPPEARKAHLALTTEASLDAHEARHAVGSILLTTIWHASREKWQPTQIDSHYRKRLQELATHKLDDPVFRQT